MPKLITKLAGYGIQGKLLDCINSFLTNRVQQVRVGKCLSNPLNTISGVPQGSVLGPILFLLFINDLPDIFDPVIASKLFADDFKAYNVDDFRLNPVSRQDVLDKLTQWATTWQLDLSLTKCGSLLLQPDKKWVNDIDLIVGDNTLTALETVLDLGVTIDCNLTFCKHINIIVAKAKQRIYLIFISLYAEILTLWLLLF